MQNTPRSGIQAVLKFFAIFSAVILPMGSAYGQGAPLVDSHQHLISPDLIGTVLPPFFKSINSEELISLLDAAGIQRSLVLSSAYIWGGSAQPIENEYERVKSENDWVSQQVAQFPDRLRGFCSVNPLKDYALEEIARCASDSQLRFGLKLNFNNSGVDFHNPSHVVRLQEVFHIANENGMAIVVHLMSRNSYGPDEVRIFLTEVMPSAMEVPIQIAHLSGSGGYDSSVDQTLEVFIDSIEGSDQLRQQLWFDVSAVFRPNEDLSAEMNALVAVRIREIGINRVVYGTDASLDGRFGPRDVLTAFQKLPLTEAEFSAIASNIPPYLQ